MALGIGSLIYGVAQVADDSRGSVRAANREALLETFPKGGRGAEIGVWKGDFTEVILRVCAPRLVHLIDPWLYQPDFANTSFGHARNRDRLQQMYRAVAARFADDPRVSIHRMTSEEALSAFSPGALDWVYVDGNHNEPFIGRDLELSLRAVRPGGIIAGDDYFWKADDGDDRPVQRAVDAFVQKLGQRASFTRFGGQYRIELTRG